MRTKYYVLGKIPRIPSNFSVRESKKIRVHEIVGASGQGTAWGEWYTASNGLRLEESKDRVPFWGVISGGPNQPSKTA